MRRNLEIEVKGAEFYNSNPKYIELMKIDPWFTPEKIRAYELSRKLKDPYGRTDTTQVAIILNQEFYPEELSVERRWSNVKVSRLVSSYERKIKVLKNERNNR